MTKCQTFQEVKERLAAAGPTRKHINGLRDFFSDRINRIYMILTYIFSAAD